MSKTTAHNSSQKLRFLKYSLLAFVMVGTSIMVPLESKAGAIPKNFKNGSKVELSKGQKLSLSQKQALADQVREGSKRNNKTIELNKLQEADKREDAKKQQQMIKQISKYYESATEKSKQTGEGIKRIVDKLQEESAKESFSKIEQNVKRLQEIKNKVEGGQGAEISLQQIKKYHTEAETISTNIQNLQNEISFPPPLPQDRNAEASTKNKARPIPCLRSIYLPKPPPQKEDKSAITTNNQAKPNIIVTPAVERMIDKQNTPAKSPDDYLVPVPVKQAEYLPILANDSTGAVGGIGVSERQQNLKQATLDTIFEASESCENLTNESTISYTIQDIPLDVVTVTPQSDIAGLEAEKTSVEPSNINKSQAELAHLNIEFMEIRVRRQELEKQQQNPNTLARYEALEKQIAKLRLEEIEAKKKVEEADGVSNVGVMQGSTVQPTFKTTKRIGTDNTVQEQFRALYTESPQENDVHAVEDLNKLSDSTQKGSKNGQNISDQSQSPITGNSSNVLDDRNTIAPGTEEEKATQNLLATGQNKLSSIPVTMPKEESSKDIILDNERSNTEPEVTNISTALYSPDESISELVDSEDDPNIFEEKFAVLASGDGQNAPHQNNNPQTDPIDSDTTSLSQNEQSEDGTLSDLSDQAEAVQSPQDSLEEAAADNDSSSIYSQSSSSYDSAINSEEGLQSSEKEESEESQLAESMSEEQDIELSSEEIEDVSDKKDVKQENNNILKSTTHQSHKTVNIINTFIRNTRLDSSSTAVAAGDDDEARIQRGLWIRGIYGINNQGRVENINGYKGINKGLTIGFDVENENNIIGIAYSNVHSLFKFKNNKNNDKEIINSHVISIYGQKVLPKNFVVQALVSASKNFINDKITYSLNNAKFKSNVKHRNYSYNAETLLNYNYLIKNNVIITPNIGLRYGKSRDGVYNEIGINVQETALTMKENNILTGIIGTKVKIPLKDILKFNNLGLTMHGSIEHNFKEKTQRVNRVIRILDNKFTQNYAIPKQPKIAYNLGTSIMGNIKNTTISLEYNYYLNKHYHSHQGSIKLKVNL